MFKPVHKMSWLLRTLGVMIFASSIGTLAQAQHHDNHEYDRDYQNH